MRQSRIAQKQCGTSDEIFKLLNRTTACRAKNSRFQQLLNLRVIFRCCSPKYECVQNFCIGDRHDPVLIFLRKRFRKSHLKDRDQHPSRRQTFTFRTARSLRSMCFSLWLSFSAKGPTRDFTLRERSGARHVINGREGGTF